MRRRRLFRALTAALGGALVAAAAGCATHAPPSADQPPPPAPDLSGRTVMLLPVQPSGGGVPGGLDAELAFWLAQRAPDVDWSFPPELEQALERNPSLGIRPRALAVASFRRAEVRRIGDPLFGDLRRLGAVVGARYALLPTGGGYVSRPDGTGRVELAVALIDTRGGRVLWFGVIGGETGPPDSPAVIASAAQALALTLFP